MKEAAIMNTATIDGRRFVLVPEAEYKRLRSGTKVVVPEDQLPALPKRLASGNYPAVEYARVSLARKIIIGRKERGWSQAELARRAGIQPAVLNRIERGKVTADTATIDKIEAAME